MLIFKKSRIFCRIVAVFLVISFSSLTIYADSGCAGTSLLRKPLDFLPGSINPRLLCYLLADAIRFSMQRNDPNLEDILKEMGGNLRISLLEDIRSSGIEFKLHGNKLMIFSEKEKGREIYVIVDKERKEIVSFSDRDSAERNIREDAYMPYDHTFLDKLSGDEVRQYFLAKGVTLEIEDLNKKGRLSDLKKIAACLAILPKEHLPKQLRITNGRFFKDDVFGKRRGDDVEIRLDSPLLKEIGIYKSFIHEVAKGVKKDVKKEFNGKYGWEREKLIEDNKLLSKPILPSFALTIFVHTFLILKGLVEFSPLNILFSIPYTIVVFYIIQCVAYYFISGGAFKTISNEFWKVLESDENYDDQWSFYSDFNGFYMFYVADGDILRKAVERSRVLEEAYNYMKEKVFNGIEYKTIDTNKQVFIDIPTDKQQTSRQGMVIDFSSFIPLLKSL